MFQYYLSGSPILILASVLTVLLYFRYLWNRRLLYYYGRKVNGPLSLPIIGAFYRFIFADNSRIMEILGAYSDKYSGFYSIWFGQELKFFIAIPEYLDKILTNSDAFDKADEYEVLFPVLGNGIFTAPAPFWKKNRKMMNLFLGKKNLNEFMKTSLKHLNRTTNELKTKIKNGEKANLINAIILNAMETSFETAFGNEEELLSNEYRNKPLTFAQITEGLFQRTYNIRYHNYYLFASSEVGKTVLGLINQFRGIVRSIIKSKGEGDHNLRTNNLISTEDQKLCLLDYLSAEFREIKEEHKKIIIDDELTTFIVTSSDTSATAMNFLLLVLGMFPEIQEKVVEEVIEVYGKSDPIDWKKINELKYLDRVFNETLRIFPVGPFVGRKFTNHIEIGDNIILPKGSSLIIPILYIHRLEKYWPDPLKFDPDRFLPENMTNRHRCTYLPFLHGPRNCVGMLFAQINVKSTIASIVREFYLISEYKKIEEIKLSAGVILKPKDGFKMHIKLRQ